MDIVEHSGADDEEKASGDIQHAEQVIQSHHVHQNFLPAKSFRQELALWSGYVNTTPFWEVFIKPFPMALSPVVICGFFIYGVTTAWIVTLSVSSSIIFGSPPLLFNSKQVGLMSVG